MNKTDSIYAIAWFAGLTFVALSLAQLHVVLAWVGYPVAAIAAIAAGQSAWHVYALHRGYADPPASGEDDIAAGVAMVFWCGLAVIELVAAIVAWIAWLAS